MTSKMVRRMLMGALFCLFLFASPAKAQDNYEETPTLTCTPATVEAGTQVTCTITGCNTGSVADFEFNGVPVGSATAASPASITFPVPEGTPPGQAVVSATCPGVATALSTQLNVITATGTAAPSTSTTTPSTLTATGANSLGLAQISLALIAVGGLLVLASRKRRAAEVTSSS